MDRISCHSAVEGLAADQDGVVSRRQLRQLGIDHDDISREVESGRWAVRGTQTVALHRGAPSVLARRWSAIWETGAAIGVLDGVSSLQHSGLTGYVDDDVHLSVVHNHNTRLLPGVRIHKVIRRVAGEVIDVGLPRTRSEVAAVRAAHWARFDRQAALLLLMPVQQRLTTPARLAAAQRLVRGRTRRSLIRSVVRDIAFGVQSLGELDFAALCRARGLPDPVGKWCVRVRGVASTSTSAGMTMISSWRSTAYIRGSASIRPRTT